MFAALCGEDVELTAVHHIFYVQTLELPQILRQMMQHISIITILFFKQFLYNLFFYIYFLHDQSIAFQVDVQISLQTLNNAPARYHWNKLIGIHPGGHMHKTTLLFILSQILTELTRTDTKPNTRNHLPILVSNISIHNFRSPLALFEIDAFQCGFRSWEHVRGLHMTHQSYCRRACLVLEHSGFYTHGTTYVQCWNSDDSWCTMLLKYSNFTSSEGRRCTDRPTVTLFF